MAEQKRGQGLPARGVKRFLKNKFILAAILLLGGGVFFFCLPKQKIIDVLGGKAGRNEARVAVSSVVPDRDADIVGMIEAVSGNEITVLTFDPSNIPDVPMTGTQNSSKKSSTSGNAISLGQTSSGGMFGGGPPSGGFSTRSFSRSSSSSSSNKSSSSSNSSSNNRETIMTELKADSTGKMKLTVPIGIAIMKAANADAQGGQESTSFTDLTSDTMVKIWLKKTGDGKNVAEYVDITGKVKMSNSTNQ